MRNLHRLFDDGLHSLQHVFQNHSAVLAQCKAAHVLKKHTGDICAESIVEFFFDCPIRFADFLRGIVFLFVEAVYKLLHLFPARYHAGIGRVKTNDTDGIAVGVTDFIAF